jgi:ribosome-associated translation inhibitor RaiA
MSLKDFKYLELSKFPELDEVDESILEKNFERFFNKVKLCDGDLLHLSVKEYSRGGIRSQHEIKANFILKGKKFSSNFTNWQFLEAVQQTLKKLEKEVQKSTSK